MYVDNILAFGRINDAINKLLEDLKGVGPTIKLASDIAGYIDVGIYTIKDSQIKMKQTGLIIRIIQIMELDKANSKETQLI